MVAKSVLATGLLEQIAETGCRLTHRSRSAQGDMAEIIRTPPVENHQAGFQLIGRVLNETGAVADTGKLFGIGHRVVHGGEKFREPTIIHPEVIETIRRLIPLAPLHNPANLLGIEVAMAVARNVPQVAVFDTAFHQSIPPYAFRYALPQALYTDHGVRRYGFHGTSHFYVAKQAAIYLKRSLAFLNLITLHLGNGASVTAIKNGKSVDTSMGLTPLEGLIMGTRSGDIDPAIIFYLGRQAGYSLQEIESMLNKQSGLKGICGLNDMREIGQLAAKGNKAARLAIDMYCYRIKKYIGAYYAAMGRIDALVFVGDCVEEKIDDLCQLAGTLGIHGVPAFMFHEGGDARAEQAFRQIAKLTKGAYCPFDAGSARQLRDLLGAVAVYAAGGHLALERFGQRRGEAVQRLSRQIDKG
mgnify:CR=1 FL=1